MMIGILITVGFLLLVAAVQVVLVVTMAALIVMIVMTTPPWLASRLVLRLCGRHRREEEVGSDWFFAKLGY